MRNKQAMTVHEVAMHLKRYFPTARAQESDCPDVEDDSVYITDTIHVQVSSQGSPELTVGHEDGEGITFYPGRLSIAEVVADIKRIK